MKSPGEKLLAFGLLLLVLLVNAAALSPELSIARVDLNDNVFHYTLIERMVRTVEAGGNALDTWSAEWSFGYPVLRTYQPLAHLLVVALYFAFGKTISLMTLFLWARFLSIALLPATFFVSARWLGLSRVTAAAAAVLAPLVSTDLLYGVEFGSFTWAGSGLFPQAVATHLLLLSLGAGWIAVRSGRRVVVSGVLVGLTVLSHLIYGYIGALSLMLLALLPDAHSARAARIRRTLAIGGVAFAIAAFQLIPLLADTSLINHSRWEPAWKWDSFGAGPAMLRLITGELLDHGRLPLLTILAGCGAALLIWNRRRARECSAAHGFIAAGAALWILLYFGRPFWGSLLTLLAISEDMHLHRVIGGAQIFLVLLAAIALAEAWRELARRRQVAAALAATGLLLYPMARERAQYLENNAAWGRRNLENYAGARPAIDSVIARAKQRGGRVYAGLAGAWGGRFKVGDVPFYAFLSTAQVPTVGFLYHAMALTGDILVRFNDRDLTQYRLFNIQSVIAPAGAPPPAQGLLAQAPVGQFQVFDAPGGGYFDLVDVAAAVTTNRRNFYDVNDRWLASGWPSRRTHLLLDWSGSAPAGGPRIAPDAPLPFLASGAPDPGSVSGEQQSGETYRAECDVLRPAYALFKMTWHPNWQAYVDGRPQPSVMLSPGFSGVAVAPGHHTVEFRYEPGPLKPVLAIGGLLLVLLLGICPPIGATLAAVIPQRVSVPRRVYVGAGILALSLPVMVPLFASGVLAGHDSFEYFPRVVEMQRNLANGILLPRWAPDLGNGYGQPVFVFRPPFFYAIAEAWRLLGQDVVTAVNLACALLVLAAAVAMFLLGRLYFGETGGWLAAAAYLYAPYFAVDLYVRSALEEFAAFPLFPLALYGFGAFARSGRRRYWILGACAYAALLCCHFPAALLFTPVLLGFLTVTAWSARSWRMLAEQGGGLALAAGLSAWSWLPAIAEKQYVAMGRVLEGNFQYALHFVYLHQLFDPAWGYGLSLPGPNDGMSFSLGWSHVLVAVAACVWVARRPKHASRVPIRFFAVAGVALCALMLPDAVWIWDHAPLLPYVEFPWRLLGPATLCLAILAAGLAPMLDALRAWRRRAAITAALALLIVPNLPHLRPPRIADVDLAFWTPHELAVRGFESTTLGEVTPRWMTAVPPYEPRAAAVVSGDAVTQEIERTPFSWSGKVQARTESRVRMSIAYYPGWSVRVDGRPAPVIPAPGSGLVEFAVASGDHAVEVSWGRSPARRLGEGISLLALAVVALLPAFLRRRRVAAETPTRAISLPA